MSDWLDAPPPAPPVSLAGAFRASARFTLLGNLVYPGLLVLMLLRLVERPLFGRRRPWTPAITRAVCRASLPALGLRYIRRGRPMRGAGAVVANHASWLDIFTLNAGQRVCFVAKREVAGWFGIGILARATGTVFIARRSGEAGRQRAEMAARLRDGHRLLFFPEGTSSDSLRVLAFKSSLFEAVFAPGLPSGFHVQPVTVIYHAPSGQDARFYGWWGDMSFVPHLRRVLSVRRRGTVEIIYHPPVAVADFADRKALARHCEAVIRAAHDAALRDGTPAAGKAGTAAAASGN